MKNMQKYLDAIGGVKVCDELVVKRALEKAGLYSKSEMFPLASLQFELTSCCNASCKHCYNNSGTQTIRQHEMTPNDWINFAKYLIDRGGVFECILSGGEPFLFGEKLFDLMDVLHDDGTLFLLQTNGSLLTQKTAKRLSKYRYHWFQISIDGTSAEYHDSFRQSKGLWRCAVEAATAVAKEGIPLKIAHCVTPYNLQDIDRMCRLAHSLGASAITIGELCLSGRVAENQNLLLSDGQRNVLFQKIKENRAKYKGKMIVKGSNSVRTGLERQRESPTSSALIRPNGDIRIDSMAPFVIGNVLKDDFEEVWARIETAWSSPAVEEYISGFDDRDRNYSFINFAKDDIRL